MTAETTDRAWFQANPMRTHRMRGPGETEHGLVRPCSHVLVSREGDGLHVRRIFMDAAGMPLFNALLRANSEAMLQKLKDGLCGGFMPFNSADLRALGIHDSRDAEGAA